MGAEMQRIGPAILGSQVRADVAMLLDYDNRFAFQIQANNPNFFYPAHFQAIYSALHRRNVAVDVIAGSADFSSYKLIIAPAYHVLPEAVASALERFVKAGGVVLVTPRTGVKDGANAIVEMPLPGYLAELCGIVVDEYDSLPSDASQPLAFEHPAMQGASATARAWCDIVQTKGAEVIARYTEGYYSGTPAVTCQQAGAGYAIYVATFGDTELYAALADWLMSLASVTPGLSAPAGVEVCTRWQGDTPLYFVINHNDHACEVEFGTACLDLLTGQSSGGAALTLAPHQVLVLRPEEDAG